MTTFTIGQLTKQASQEPDNVVRLPTGLGAATPQALQIDVNEDGSTTYTFDSAASEKLDPTKFYQNLAVTLGTQALGTLANEILMGIEEDDRSRQDWLDERAEGLRLLGLKLEDARNGPDAASPVQGLSSVRDSGLLESCLRFQANARSELLPTDGPVKVADAVTGDAPAEDDELADLLEDNMNYYLLQTATEYYPDTDRMLLWVGFGGSGFKKVYICPLRRRPVAESVDAENVIISNAATDISNADRVTHVIHMRQTTMRRMQKVKAYRDVSLGMPANMQKSSVDSEKESISGVVASARPEDMSFTIYECYCLVEVPGDEQKDGLPRPYKISLDKDSREILEIRRNWKEDDEMERPRRVLVKYPYVPGLGFYDLGLVHILGNLAKTATALLREMVDAGMFANFPGGLKAKGTGRQNSTDITVPPGGFADIDVSMIQDGDIRKAVMALPYKEPGQAIMALYTAITEKIGRLGGVAEIQVGEGRQDAPVGTTIALIEQATKPLDAVHKRLHAAQAEEFEMLRELFEEDPSALWRFSKRRPNQEMQQKLTVALQNYNLVPRADPNTSSEIQRQMRVQALTAMAEKDPGAFNIRKIEEIAVRALKFAPADVMNQDPQGPPPDPEAQAKLLAAQADLQDSQTKAAELQFRTQNSTVEDQNRDLDRQADIKVAQLGVQKELLMHRDKMGQAEADSQRAEIEAGRQRGHDAAQAQQGREHDQRHDLGMAVVGHVLGKDAAAHGAGLAPKPVAKPPAKE
jgi:hypothetical protein